MGQAAFKLAQAFLEGNKEESEKIISFDPELVTRSSA